MVVVGFRLGIMVGKDRYSTICKGEGRVELRKGALENLQLLLWLLNMWYLERVRFKD